MSGDVSNSASAWPNFTSVGHTHRPWCSDHLDSPCPVSGEPYSSCQLEVHVVPAGTRTSGISLIVYQEPGMAAPLVRVESDLSEMTPAEAHVAGKPRFRGFRREFGQALTDLLDRIDVKFGKRLAEFHGAS